MRTRETETGLWLINRKTIFNSSSQLRASLLQKYEMGVTNLFGDILCLNVLKHFFVNKFNQNIFKIKLKSVYVNKIRLIIRPNCHFKVTQWLCNTFIHLHRAKLITVTYLTDLMRPSSLTPFKCQPTFI